MNHNEYVEALRAALTNYLNGHNSKARYDPDPRTTDEDRCVCSDCIRARTLLEVEPPSPPETCPDCGFYHLHTRFGCPPRITVGGS